MSKFIWILSSVWAVLFLFLLLKSGSNDRYFWLGVFIILFIPGLIISVASGVVGNWKFSSDIMPAVVNALAVLIGFAVLYFIKEFPRYDFRGVHLIFIPSILTFVVTFLSSKIMGFCLSAGNGLPGIALKIIIPGIALFLIYLLFAHFSYQDVFFKKDWFWNEPDEPDFLLMEVRNTVNYDFGIGPMHPVMQVVDPSMQPFTGLYKTREDKLKVNPFPAKVTGLNYYVNGWLWGYSGSATYLYKYFSDFIGQPKLPSVYDIHAYGQPDKPVLIHKAYEQRVRDILQEFGDYMIVSEYNLNEPYFYRIIFYEPQGDIIYKKIITYHGNGIINKIEPYQYNMVNEREWISLRDASYSFDMLGYFDPYCENERLWNPADFILTDSIPDPLIAGEATDTTKMNLEKVFTDLAYNRVPQAEEFVWNEGMSVAENVARMYDGNWNEVGEVFYTHRMSSKEEYMMDIQDQQELKRIFSSSTSLIIEPDLEEGVNRIPVFSFVDEESGKIIFVYYLHGRFVVGNKFQSVLIDRPEDREIVQQIVSKYSKNRANLIKREKS